MRTVLSKNLALLASAPDGIQKLRGLIFELAVRGKLVPQDPNDEPASELLKRIAKERDRLETEGTYKQSKAASLVGDVEQPFASPDGWEWSRLSAVSIINPRNSADDSINASFVPMAMIGTSFDGKHAQEHRKWGEIRQGFTHFAENDIGVAKITPCFENSKACVFQNLQNGIGAGTTELHIVRPIGEALVPRFVLAYLKAPMFLMVGETRMTGTAGQKRLPKDFLELNPFPLPPLAEQHRIVAKVDELMTLCDRLETEQTDAEVAHAQLVVTLLGTLTQSADATEFAANWKRLAEHFDTLFTTESSLDALKQTILQLAVTGKLVPQDPNDEPVSELLKRIAMERARLESEGVCKKTKAMPVVDEDALYSLPSSWQWSALDPLVRVMDSGWSPACIETPSRNDDVWGVLKTTAVQTFQYLEYENKELPAHLKPRPECEVAPGDILITRAGPKNRVAISCLVETTRPRLMISDKIIRFHLVEGGMYEKFVALCLNAGATASFLESAKSGMAASQMNITQQKLRAAPIPICSTAEQHRIVAKVDELMALCDRLKIDLAESRSSRARLSAALVESALQAA